MAGRAGDRRLDGASRLPVWQERAAPITRRSFLGLLGGAAAVAAGGIVVPAFAHTAGPPATTATSKPTITGVDLDVSMHGGTAFPYPFFADWADVMHESQRFLDALAVAYGK